MINLAGKVALVTGASRGIGRAVADTLQAAGATVLYNARVPAADLPAERSLVADVTRAEQVDAMIEQVIRDHGRLDILVNNAGITRDALLMRMKEEDWDAVLTTNLKSCYYTCRAAIRPMMKQRSGRIINMASVVGLTGNAGQCNYSASKAGLIGFTKSLAREVGARGITVNAVAPGFIRTAMTDQLPAEVKTEMQKQIVLGRLGEAQDVANAVLILASDLASYITGQVLNADGGMVMS